MGALRPPRDGSAYTGFVMPKPTAVTDPSGKITDVTVSYSLDLTKQMLKFSGVR